MSLSNCGETVDEHQKEMQEHGNLQFPIACYDDDVVMHSVPWHWHEEFEIIVATQGEVEVLVESGNVTLKKGDGIFINSGVLHGVSAKGSVSNLHSAVFHGRFVGGNMDSVFWQKRVQPFLNNKSLRCKILVPHVKWQRELMDAFNRAWTAVVKEVPDFENEARYEISKAMGILRENCEMDSTGLSVQENLDAIRIRGMLTFIEKHLADPLTIAEIAQSVNIGISACQRCFTLILGTTPMQYVKNSRIERAADMVLRTNVSAKDAAFACGFNDISYFTKSFREKMGCTPGEYRKKAEHHQG